jgi:FdhD protein
VTTKGQSSIERRTVTRHATGAPASTDEDHLAVEEPLQIRLDTRPITVTMRTPGHDEELAIGFLLSEGLIRQRSDVLKTTIGDANLIDVYLAPEVAVDFAQLTRHVVSSSSCGLCGKASIESIHRHFQPLTTTMTVRATTLHALPEKLREAQQVFHHTGGLHAAGVFDAHGNLIVLREDIGRHNAVDKVIGFALLQGHHPLERHILVVSGRASFEIMQKALAARIPIVAAVSAASNLAAKFADESGQTLIGFLRGERMNIYSHPQRIASVD